MAVFRNSIRLLTTGIAFLVIGIVLTVMTVGDMIDNAKTPADFYSLSEQDIKAGMMVECDLEYNYGSYVEVTKEKDSGAKSIVGYYYMIDAGQESYMALYTPIKDLIKQLDAQADTLWDYWDGKSDAMPTPVHIKGKIEKMDKEDIGLFEDQLETFGFTSDEIDQYGLNYYIKVTDTSTHPILLVVGIVVTVLGLLFGFLFVRNKMMGR